MKGWIALVFSALIAVGAAAAADTQRSVDARDINIVSEGQGNDVSVNIGGIDGAEIEGVSIINGSVFIDGRQVPDSATRYRSRSRSGVVYLIRRSATGVEIVDEASVKGRK